MAKPWKVGDRDLAEFRREVEALVEAARGIVADWDITGSPRPGTRTHPLRAALEPFNRED